jgi:mannitol/fructose-specific phosphotransferase system IIA component
MEEEWSIIASQIHSEEAAIDRLFLLLAQEGVVPEEFVDQIKGRKIVNGDLNSIMNVVQLMNEMVDQALEEG